QGNLNGDFAAPGEVALEVISAVRRYKSENQLSLKAEVENVEVFAKDVQKIKPAEIDIISTCSIENISYTEAEEFRVGI
ncbi:MAG: valine--tRNA ligase, partial [Oscillospiraceae bacterium]|nr:valine--tRNA ligase [Oscillospiraceae bacterium]